ncbi:HDIG domain-containing metalloprotein [Insulibacter thermoxylanivorax]
MQSQSARQGSQAADSSRKSILNGWKDSLGVRIALFFCLAVLFYVSTSDKLLPKTYNLEPGMVSEHTILAPKQIPNEAATRKAQDEAAERVQPVYAVVPMQNGELLSILFDKLEQINGDPTFTNSERYELFPKVFPAEYEAFFEQKINAWEASNTYNESVLTAMRNAIQDQAYRIPQESYYKFTRLSAETLEQMETVALPIVNKLMSEPIENAEQARARVAEMVNASSLNTALSREIAQEIIRFVITPNKFSDAEATIQAKEAARNNVEPIYIQKNEVLVRQGEMITPELYQILQQYDLLGTEINYAAQFGLILLILLMAAVLYWYIRQSDLNIRHNNVQLLMLLLIFVINVIVMKIVALAQSQDYPYLGYLAPAALGSMLIAILLEGRLAIVCSVIFSILSSIIFNSATNDQLFDYHYGFVSLVVCFAAVFAIQKASQRSAILKTGLLISLLGGLAVLSITLLQDQYDLESIALSLVFVLASGLLTAVLAIGLLPFFEVSFGILSPLKLIELSNPNHPLLRKLLVETPGTYHHSVMVGNLAEAAAEAIGANGLLCRVGSFYHDIGKTKRPSYFIENQGNMGNPHDDLDPSISKEIIIAHARDGEQMLREYKMPKQLRDIAEQHHGTTLLKYFYHKAIKLAEENNQPIDFTEEDYRYPGPKAQTKEAAIVGIADSVEAAVRSLHNPSLEQISALVDKIIKDRLEDNQFNECDLTLRELDIIGSTLKESLLGIFHSRIEYPEDTPKKTEDGESSTNTA